MKPRIRTFFHSTIVLAASSVFATTSIVVANQTWTGAASADWNTPANWTSAVPTASELATFDATSTANLATTLSANAAVSGIVLNNPPAAVSVTSAANTAFVPFAAITAAAATDSFTYVAANAHPLANGDRVAFTGTMPTGVTAAGTYFVVNATATNFKVSATAGGAPIDITTDSAAMFVDGLVLPANATDTFAYSAAFYSAQLPNGSLVSFTGTVPTGLTFGANYYVINSTATTFQVATAPGGPAVDFTTDGTNVRAFPTNAPQLTMGGSGFNVSDATASATVSSIIAGSSGLTKSGPGSVTLGGVNTFTGAVTVNAGNLTLAAANVYAGGTTIKTGGTLTLGTNISFNTGGIGPGTLTFQGGTLTTNFGANNTALIANPTVIDLGQTGTFNAPNGFEYSGAVSGAGTYTMNLASNKSRSDFRNDFTNFVGVLNLQGTGVVRFRINQSAPAFNGAGLTNATLVLGTGLTLQVLTNSGGNTVLLGALQGGGQFTGGTAGALTLEIGALGVDCIFDGGAINNTNFNKKGSESLTFTAATGLDYTGTTTVTAGTLRMNGVKTGTGVVNVLAGATLGGTGSIAGVISIPKDAHLSPGDPNVASGVGTLTVTNMSLSTGSILDIDVGAGANDKVSIAAGGTLTLSPGIIVNPMSNGNLLTTNGTYPIFHIVGGTVNGFNSTVLAVPANASGKTYRFITDGSDISLVVSDTVVSNYWKTNGDGSWGASSNWKTGVVPNAISAVATFDPYYDVENKLFFSNSPDVTLDGNRTLGELSFDYQFGDVSFTIARGSSGSLNFDNGPAIANIVHKSGTHFITAPLVVDPDGLAVDVAGASSLDPEGLEISGVISGASASVKKTGSGALTLTGSNTFGGGMEMAAGTARITQTSSLGSGIPRFNGGTLGFTGDLTTSLRFQIMNTASAQFDTSGFNIGLTGGVDLATGGTGGLTKIGDGTLKMGGPSTYTGATTVNTGVLEFATGSSVPAGVSFNTVAGTGQLVVSGGSIVATGVSSIAKGSGGLLVSGGSAAFNGGINSNDNSSTNVLITVTGGTFSSGFITMGRSAGTITTPAAGSTTAGLYINGGVSSVAGALNIGFSSSNVNSSASARIDAGSLTVGGPVLVTLANGGRWSILDVNGGDFISTDTVGGVQLGSTITSNGTNFEGNAAMLVRAGTATVDRLLLFQAAASTTTSLLNVTGGSLYVGSGGIVGNNNGGTGILSVTLGAATLGATANWGTLLPVSVTGTTVQAANAAAAPFDILLAGAVSGTDLIKTGGGTLTLSGANSYTGTTTVTAGTLRINGDNTLATGAITVAAGAKLGGIGTTTAPVTVSGSIAPGSPTGTLTLSSVTFNAGSALEIALNGGTAPQTGTLAVSGALNITNLKLKFTSTGVLTQPTYVIAKYGTLTGTQFSSIEGLPAGATIDYHYNNGVNSNNIAISIPLSPYATWAGDPVNGLTPGVNDGPTQDPDGDGIANVLEFVLGGNPSIGSNTILPKLAVDATNFVFTFNRADASEAGVPLTFEWGTTLSPLANPVVVGPTSSTATGGVTVNVVEGGAAPDVITITVPRSNAVGGKIFGRLKAVR